MVSLNCEAVCGYPLDSGVIREISFYTLQQGGAIT